MTTAIAVSGYVKACYCYVWTEFKVYLELGLDK